jgi:hypothetical protein
LALVRHFAVSGEGPKTAEQWHDTVLPASELQNLPDRTFYFQTLVNGRPHDPLLTRAYPPIQKEHMRQGWGRKGLTAEKDVVIRRSLQNFGRDRRNVESQLSRFLSAA